MATQEYASLREKIAAEKAEREARYAAFELMWEEAVQKGDEAAGNCVPTPMIVGSPTHPLGSDIDPSKPVYFEPEGVCGFAWVEVRPGTSSFARWAVKKGIMRKRYGGGVSHWVGGFGQSHARKLAWAHAVAEVLREAGIRAFAGDRLD